MFKVVRLKGAAGDEYSVFVGCLETGYAPSDLLTMPGAYDECQASDGGTSLKLRQLTGTIGNYHTECYALCVTDGSAEVQDITSDVSRILTMPATAANAMMQAMSPQLREDVKQAIDSIHYCESVTADSKVCLPAEAMSDIDPNVAASMHSARQSYVLKSTENQEIFQKTFDGEFGVRLPTLDDIHNESGFKYSALDLLRATMPYRRPGNPPVYEPLYHTPYYKVGNQMGMVPQHLQWLEGYSSNDLLDIQPNERHMQRNLYTLYQSDVARYVAEMVTGVFFNTEYGSKLARLRLLRDRDAIDRLVSELRLGGGVDSGPNVSCPLSTTDIEELWANDWNPTEVGRRVKERISFDDGYLKAIVEAQHPAKRIVTTRNLMFVVALTDAQEQEFTSLFIERGFISHELHEFFLRLCQRAYEVNWGHTGSARAIPPLVYQGDQERVANEWTQYLTARSAGKAPSPLEYMSLYRDSYGDPTLADDDEAVNVFSVDSDSDDDGTVSISFDYYITKTTQGRMMSGELDYETLYGIRGDESDADRRARLEATQDSDTRKVERWRLVNGNSNLVFFLTGAYMKTADVKVYIQAFIKLLRWGERRPKVLALPDHPEIRIVFDLCNGSEGDNTAVVDESELVKVNGCDYSFAGFLSSTTNNDINPQHIVGFLLEKNYGTVVKQYLASWEDIAEMVETGSINIGEFKTNAAVNVDPGSYISIESFEKRSYEVYESNASIAEGLTLKVRGRELSRVILLTRPQIMSDRSYIRSTLNSTIITLQDRQYDNLRQYAENLKRFYASYGSKVSAAKTTTDLRDLALLFSEMSKTGSAPKQEQNAKVAASAIRTMSLDMGGTGEVQYSDAPLEGKFILVLDKDNATVRDDTWEPMQFTNPQLVNIAARPGVNIVLLLLKTADGWVLCRKDIQPMEVDVIRVDGKSKIHFISYTKIQPQIMSLLKGGQETYNGLPLQIHMSAKLPNR